MEPGLKLRSSNLKFSVKWCFCGAITTDLPYTVATSCQLWPNCLFLKIKLHGLILMNFLPGMQQSNAYPPQTTETITYDKTISNHVRFLSSSRFLKKNILELTVAVFFFNETLTLIKH